MFFGVSRIPGRRRREQPARTQTPLSVNGFPLLLQSLEKTYEVPPERGLGRIVALANKTNLPGSVDNNNRRKPQAAKFVPHSASGIKCQRYRNSLFFGKCAHALRCVPAYVASDQNKLNVGVIAQ